MLYYLKLKTTPIWLLLVLATGLSWWLGHEVGSPQRQSLLAISMILIASIKIRLVLQYFMEARYAPLALRLALDGWLLGMTLAILTTYWVGL